MDVCACPGGHVIRERGVRWPDAGTGIGRGAAGDTGGDISNIDGGRTETAGRGVGRPVGAAASSLYVRDRRDGDPPAGHTVNEKEAVMI